MEDAAGARPVFNNVDSVRLLLALAVIWSHSFALGAGSEDREPISILTNGQMNAGNVAVFFFFSISGYLITESWLRKPDALTFLKKRFARIYPGFLVATLCAVLFFAPLGLGRPPGAIADLPWRHIVLSAVRLQDFGVSGAFGGNSLHAINGSLWSISYEFWCYLGVLCLGFAGALRRPVFLWLVLVATVATNEYLVHTGWLPGGKLLGVVFGAPFLWTRLLPYFLCGALLRLSRGWLPLSPWGALACVVALCALRFVPRGINVALPLLGTYAVLWFGLACRWRLPDLARFGDLSYGTYLYAFPLQQLVVMKMGGSASPVLVFATATPLTLIFAAASWHLVEKHALRWAGKRAPPAVRLPEANP